MTDLQVTGLFVEEGCCKKITLRIRTKRYPSCFSKTGLKTAISKVEKRRQTLYKVGKRWEEMTKVEKR